MKNKKIFLLALLTSLNVCASRPRQLIGESYLNSTPRIFSGYGEEEEEEQIHYETLSQELAGKLLKTIRTSCSQSRSQTNGERIELWEVADFLKKIQTAQQRNSSIINEKDTEKALQIPLAFMERDYTDLFEMLVYEGSKKINSSVIYKIMKKKDTDFSVILPSLIHISRDGFLENNLILNGFKLLNIFEDEPTDKRPKFCKKFETGLCDYLDSMRRYLYARYLYLHQVNIQKFLNFSRQDWANNLERINAEIKNLYRLLFLKKDDREYAPSWEDLGKMTSFTKALGQIYLANMTRVFGFPSSSEIVKILSKYFSSLDSASDTVKLGSSYKTLNNEDVDNLAKERAKAIFEGRTETDAAKNKTYLDILMNFFNKNDFYLLNKRVDDKVRFLKGIQRTISELSTIAKIPSDVKDIEGLKSFLDFCEQKMHTIAPNLREYRADQVLEKFWQSSGSLITQIIDFSPHFKCLDSIKYLFSSGRGDPDEFFPDFECLTGDLACIFLHNNEDAYDIATKILKIFLINEGFREEVLVNARKNQAKIIGIDDNATKVQIIDAFRALAGQCHKKSFWLKIQKSLQNRQSQEGKWNATIGDALGTMENFLPKQQNEDKPFHIPFFSLFDDEEDVKIFNLSECTIFNFGDFLRDSTLTLENALKGLKHLIFSQKFSYFSELRVFVDQIRGIYSKEIECDNGLCEEFRKCIKFLHLNNLTEKEEKCLGGKKSNRDYMEMLQGITQAHCDALLRAGLHRRFEADSRELENKEPLIKQLQESIKKSEDIKSRQERRHEIQNQAYACLEKISKNQSPLEVLNAYITLVQHADLDMHLIVKGMLPFYSFEQLKENVESSKQERDQLPFTERVLSFLDLFEIIKIDSDINREFLEAATRMITSLKDSTLDSCSFEDAMEKIESIKYFWFDEAIQYLKEFKPRVIQDQESISGDEEIIHIECSWLPRDQKIIPAYNAIGSERPSERLSFEDMNQQPEHNEFKPSVIQNPVIIPEDKSAQGPDLDFQDTQSIGNVSNYGGDRFGDFGGEEIEDFRDANIEDFRDAELSNKKKPNLAEKNIFQSDDSFSQENSEH